MKYFALIACLLVAGAEARSEVIVRAKTPLKRVEAAKIWFETDYGYACEANRKELPKATDREIAHAHAKKDLLYLPITALRNCKKAKKRANV